MLHKVWESSPTTIFHGQTLCSSITPSHLLLCPTIAFCHSWSLDANFLHKRSMLPKLRCFLGLIHAYCTIADYVHLITIWLILQNQLEPVHHVENQSRACSRRFRSMSSQLTSRLKTVVQVIQGAKQAQRFQIDYKLRPRWKTPPELWKKEKTHAKPLWMRFLNIIELVWAQSSFANWKTSMKAQ